MNQVELLLPGGRARQRAGLRGGLKQVLGDSAPLALRHGLAIGLLAAADDDADSKLSAEEVHSAEPEAEAEPEPEPEPEPEAKSCHFSNSVGFLKLV